MALVVGAIAAWAGQYGDCSRKVDADRAILACTRIIEAGGVKHTLSEAHVIRGNAHFSKGDYDRAIVDFDAAIRLQPKLAEAYIKRGFVHAAKDDFRRAIEDFGMAIKLRPGNASAYTMRADAYENAGDRDRAIADYRKALEIDPSLEVVKEALKRLGVSP
jgi:tetratricopeptide (TPR) repeat protein